MDVREIDTAGARARAREREDEKQFLGINVGRAILMRVNDERADIHADR